MTDKKLETCPECGRLGKYIGSAMMRIAGKCRRFGIIEHSSTRIGRGSAKESETCLIDPRGTL